MTAKDIIEIAAASIASIGGSGLLIFGLSSWLGKVWANRILENEKHEHAKLNVEFTHQLGLLTETTKHSLQMAQIERQIQFSKLHEKRGVIIEQIYERVLSMERDGKRFVRPRGLDPEGNEEFRKLDQELLEFYLFVERNCIYLPEHTCNLLTNYKNIITKHVGSVDNWAALGPDPSPEDIQERKTVIMAALKAFNDDIPAIKEALIADFRKMLGVESQLPELKP